MQNEKPMDMEQLADWFGVSVPTVRNWLRDGVPCLRPSPGVVRFNLSEVVEWSKKHSNDQAAV